MAEAYRKLPTNAYLNTQVRLVREWESQDSVAFSQLVDLTAVKRERERRERFSEGKASYTAFVIDSIARALRDHPKMNRIVYRGLIGYRWAQFEHIDVAVGVEAVDEGVDIAYATIIRDAASLGLDGIVDALRSASAAPFADPQLRRLKRLPAVITAVLARATGLHPRTWARFRGGSCAFTSPAKYGVETVTVKSCWPIQFALGNVKENPMIVGGQCVARLSAVLSMNWHRELTTGAVAAQYFAQVVQQLEQFGSAPRAAVLKTSASA